MNFCPALRISWSVWVKFCVRDLHLPSLGNYEFIDNRYGEIYTLLTGVNEILPIRSTLFFRIFLGKNCYRRCPQTFTE